MNKLPPTLLTWLLAASAVAALPTSPLLASERRILMFKPSVPRAQRLALAATQGVVVHDLPIIDGVAIEVPGGSPALPPGGVPVPGIAGLKAIEAAPRVNWLQAVDAPGHDFSPPDLDLAGPLGRLRALARGAEALAKKPPKPGRDAPEGVRNVRAVPAWLVTKGAGVKVAVIDTGIDAKHRDLAPNVKGGWNAIKVTPNFADDHGHGTHVAGTIAALADGHGVAGVAPEASVYGVKVIDKSGWGTTDDVIAGMQWALDNGMQVVNLSLGDEEPSKAMDTAVRRLRDAGILVVAAAGNNGRGVIYPAACPGAIAIAAVDGGNRLTRWSSRGKEVALVAPGVDVESTYPGGRYQTMSGTSMACPHAVGVAALYLAAHPGAGANEAEAGLRATAHSLRTIPDFWQGSGLPDAEAAVR